MVDIQPNQYPIQLVNLNKDTWNKKVNATLMASFQAEEQTIPVLYEWVALLERVAEKPLAETFGEEQVTEFFFNSCFGQVCQKLINSKYFKNDQVLVLSNHILELSINIYLKYLDLTLKYSKFADLAAIVFNTDAQYFKTNNQLDIKSYPWMYYNQVQKNAFLEGMQPGDMLDAIKYDISTKKATWSRAIYKQIDQDGIISIEFLNDARHATRDIMNDSIQIAPLGTFSKDFEWRMGLKQGDIIDCSEMYGLWYTSTIVKIRELQNGCKKAKVTFKVYDPAGDRSNQKGYYFGMSDSYDEDDIDVTSPRIQPANTIAKYREYLTSSRHNSDYLNDTNDHVMEYIGKQRITFIPRARFCSGFLFKVVRNFIQKGGFEAMLQILERGNNGDLLCSYITAIGDVAYNLHKNYVAELITRLKVIVNRHLVDESEATVKSLTKEKCENIFINMKCLVKRIESSDQYKEYEIAAKLELANLCLNSEALKRRLQGLSELKDILRSVRTTGASKITKIAEWLRTNRVFEKIYVEDQHVQLIKKSTEFFRFLISEDILQVQQLQLIYSTAQRGDYETRISIYKLLQQVTNSFKRPHVDFLIDQILESDINLTACQDLQLMHQLSKFSNYFPLEKVIKFFEGLILSRDLQPQLLDVSVKKYADMVVKNYDMVPYRKQIVKMFLEKLQTPQVLIVTRVLTSIFDSVGIGEYNKYDMLDFLNEVHVDQVVLDAIKYHRQSYDYLLILDKLLHFLQLVLSISQRIKLNVSTFIEYWELLSLNATSQREKELYSRWCGIISKLEYAMSDGEPKQLEEFFLKLVSPKQVEKLTKQDFQIISNLFVDLNCKQANISISTTWKNGKDEKVMRLARNFDQLKFYDKLLDVIYGVADDKVAEAAIDFYNSLYITQDLSVDLRKKYLQKTLDDFFKYLSEGHINRTPRALSLIDFIIDESEKDCGNVNIKSLATIRKGETLFLDIINDTYYSYDMTNNSKNFNLKTTSNTTLFDVRNTLAKYLSMTWQQLKISQKDELSDICNSRLMKQLNIKINEPFKVSKRYCSQTHEELLINGKLSPKAVKAFETIFNKHSTNGLMSKFECNKFIAMCLNDPTTKTYDERINSVYQKYDEDKDDFLTLKNFLDFYEDSAKDRPSTVWSNLKNCRIRYDFKSFDDPEQETVDIHDLPRYHLGQRLDFYEALFGLLDAEESVAKATWKMFQRLEISSVLYNEVLSGDESNHLKLLNLDSPYKMLYCMYLFEYLLDTNPSELKQQEQQWKDQFQTSGGYERLFDIYRTLECREEKLKPIEQDIKEFVLNMVSKYIAKSFHTTLAHNQANAVLSSQLEFTELLPLLIKPEMPKDLKDETKIKQYKKIVEPEEISQTECQWHGPSNMELVDIMLQSLRKLWSQTTNIIQRDSQINNCLSILLSVLLNEDTTKLCEVLPELLCKPPSGSILKQLYLFVCALCFFSNSGQQRVIDCLLTFLKDDKADVINDEYFKTITALIAKYGLAKDNESVTDILVSNVMNRTNQQVIQGCSNLLCFIQNQHIDQQGLQKIWEKCLFGDKVSCRSEGSRTAVYGLLAAVAKNKPNLTKYLLNLTLATLNKEFNRLRVLSQNQLKNRSPYNYAGVKNLGAICYMLSIIQQFYMNRTFRNLILRVDDKKTEEYAEKDGRTIDDNILHQIQRLFAFMSKTQRMDYNPQDFCFSWKTYDGQPINVLMQQDAQQFTSMFLDRLEKSMKDTPFRKVVEGTYTGKVSNLLTCEKCQKSKIRQEDFYCLTLEVKNYKILSESLGKLVQGQIINDYQCDFCSQKADVVKKTVISKCPNNLILHLQRNVFNLDTFVNEKISTKFEFPQTLNLKPYSIQAILPMVSDKPAATDQPTETKLVEEEKKSNDDNYEYDLVGVVAHNGGAEFGHYYSFIKTQNGQWLEFNDSNVYSFDVKKLEAECYGGITEVIEDEFDWTKKENSKNAYMLIYEKRKKESISLCFVNEDQKRQVLQTLDLKEKQENKKIKNVLESLSRQDDDEDKKLPAKEEVILDKDQAVVTKDKEDSVHKQEIIKQKQITVYIDEPISDYLPTKHASAITEDNQFHEYEVNVCSGSFIKFYSTLLQLNNEPNQFPQLVELTQKLSFGVWIKQPKLKELLSTLQNVIGRQPSTSLSILKNEGVRNLLLESNDADLRSSISNLLLAIVNSNIEKYQLALTREGDIDTQIVDFLDAMFSLIPTTVSKNWIKFTQYFEFWKQFATTGIPQFDYLIRKECISHFYDYFLEKKSPLGIYANKKHVIGSKYASPNFAPLLETANYLIMQLCSTDPSRLTTNDRKIMSFEFFNKMITENNQKLACCLVGTLCKDSLPLSEKVAFVLIRGIFSSNYDTIQPYLDVVSAFVLIDDRFKDYRLKWVLGMPTLSLSSFDKSILAFNVYTIEERLYFFDSTLQMEQTTISMLEALYKNFDRTQIYCTLILKCLLQMCLADEFVFDYMVCVPAPCLKYSRYIDFFGPFIQKFIEQANRSTYTQANYPKAELGKTVNELYEKLVDKIKQRQDVPASPTKLEKATEANNTEDVVQSQLESATVTQAQTIKLETEPKLQPTKSNESRKVKVAENAESTQDIKLVDAGRFTINQLEDLILQDQQSSLKRSDSNSAVKSYDYDFSQEANPQFVSYQVNDNVEEQDIAVKFSDQGKYADSSDTEILDSASQKNELKIKDTYHPCKFVYHQVKSEFSKNLTINHHESRLISIKTKPNGQRNQIFSNAIKPMMEKVPEQCWKTSKEQLVRGVFLQNSSRDTYVVKWKYGCSLVKGDSVYIWWPEIEKTWLLAERSQDWPKWSLYE